ncbi:MAG: xanthine dehydrogenase FAD-binding subunit XdhB [Eubacteriales bacterium]|nr:xanthine dehydrogenase FAD-binding subunit XdhB [Eubacteriales bacterium]
MIDVNAIYEPADLAEAVRLLGEQTDAMVICGGSDMLIQNREGRYRDKAYVSVRHLPELRGIRETPDGRLMIGAASSFTEIMESEAVQRICPLLAKAVSQVGAVQIRNIGTIGGNLCNAVPSADSACAVLVHEAKLHIAGAKGVRVVPVKDFYRGGGKTAVARDEVLTAIEIGPEAAAGYSGHYTKYAMRKAMDIATVGFGILLKLSPDKRQIADVRVAYASLAPRPVRGFKLEAALRGMTVGSEIVDVIHQTCLSDVNPREGRRVSKNFKEKIVREVVKRAVNDVIVAQGGNHVYGS